MPLFEWNPSFEVQVADFNDQHRKLMALVNRLADAMKSGQGRAVISGVLKELMDYTVYHFSAEEEAFARTQYPDRASHILEHEALTNKVNELKQKFDLGQTMISVETLDFLVNWLTHHIRETDKKYGAHLNANGIR